jgi:hypothetical protein
VFFGVFLGLSVGIPNVYFKALHAFLVYLEAHCTFLIYTTLLIKKKK